MEHWDVALVWWKLMQMVRSSFSSLGMLRGTVLVGWWDLFLLSLSATAKNRIFG
jgi:hypothetical protein